MLVMVFVKSHIDHVPSLFHFIPDVCLRQRIQRANDHQEKQWADDNPDSQTPGCALKCRCLIEIHGPKNCSGEHPQHGPRNSAKDSPQKESSKDGLHQDPAAHCSQDRSKGQQDHSSQESAQDRPANCGKHPEEHFAKAISSDDANESTKACPRNTDEHGHDASGNLDHVCGPWYCAYCRSDRCPVDATEKGGNGKGLHQRPLDSPFRLEFVQVVMEFLLGFHLVERSAVPACPIVTAAVPSWQGVAALHVTTVIECPLGSPAAVDYAGGTDPNPNWSRKMTRAQSVLLWCSCILIPLVVIIGYAVLFFAGPQYVSCVASAAIVCLMATMFAAGQLLSTVISQERRIAELERRLNQITASSSAVPPAP